MGCNNRPALTDTEEGLNELSLPTQSVGADDGANSLGADFMSFPFYPPFSWPDIQGEFRSYQPQCQDENNRLAGYMNLDCLTSYPEESMREPDGNTTTGADTKGYPIKAHEGEAKNSTINMSRMIGNFSSSERSTYVLPLVDNFGVTGNKNDVAIVPAPISSAPEVDENFLTLGIGGGGGREIRSNSNFCTRDVSSKSSLDEGGFINEISARPNSIPFPGFQTVRNNMGSNFLENYETSLFDWTPSSLTSERNMPTYVGRQSISRQQDYCRKSSMNMSSGSSRNYRSDRHRGSSISHAQLGNLIPVIEGTGTQSSSGVRFPVSVQPGGSLALPAEHARTDIAHVDPFPSSAQPVGHLRTSNDGCSGEALGNRLYPERRGFHISKGGNFQSAASGPFPKRLGVQPNDFSTARTTSKGPPLHFPAQVNSFIPPAFPGQRRHDMPAQFSMDFPRVDYNTGQVLRHQPPSIVSHPSLKRKATENSATAQRRKIIPQPVMHHSAPHQWPNIAASLPSIPAAVHIPSATDHVKWEGFDGDAPEAIGQKCLLCKRDLSFTAEGRVYQPPVPPSVAVLACGHTFHDHCLQIITPKDQSKDPPCIPCAVGET